MSDYSCTQSPGDTDNHDQGIKNRGKGVDRNILPQEGNQGVLEENKDDHHEGADTPDQGDKEQENVELTGIERIRGFVDPCTAGIFGHCRSPV